MTIVVSGHELLRTKLCADPSCGDDAEHEVGGVYVCARHLAEARRRAARSRENGSGSAEKAAVPEATEGRSEPEPETPRCSKCDEPGVTRYGRAMLCEAHDRERREKTRQTLRKRTEALRLTASPPIPGGLEERLAPALRAADEAQAAYEEAREALRRAIDEAFS